MKRGWGNLRLLSSGGTTFNADYLAEADDGNQWPIVDVFQGTGFQGTGEGIFHRYATEMFRAPSEEGQHPRHVDLLWPLWNALDLTPEGRGTDRYPRIACD